MWDGEKYQKEMVLCDTIVTETTSKKNDRKHGESIKRYTEDKRQQMIKKSKERELSTAIEVNQNSDKEKIKSMTEILSSEDAAKNEEKEEDVDRVLNEVQNVCPVCLKRFDHEKRLRRHIVVSHKKRAYKCDKCHASYYTKQYLEKHCKSHSKSHSDNYFFECDISHLKYEREIMLKQHQGQAHQVHSDTAARMHKPRTICPICKKVFVSSAFYHHVLTHAEIRPYNCDNCGEAFTQRSSLFRHRKIHPGPLPPYTSQISIAGLAKIVLQKHLKS